MILGRDHTMLDIAFYIASDLKLLKAAVVTSDVKNSLRLA
jgi:hypothetical protein